MVDDDSPATIRDLASNNVVIETSRLLLRRQTREDAAFVLALMNDPDWLRYIGDRGLRTTEDAATYIERGAMKMYDRYGFGLYLVEIKDRHVPIGLCGLLKRDELEDVDVGYAFAPAYRGQGFAREAAAAAVAYARDTAGLQRIVAMVAPDNKGSSKLLKSLRFNFERAIQNQDGTWVHLLSLTL